MNKTLLIIICDFLLISILALVEFKPQVDITEPDASEIKENAADEMLELLQLSLEQENAERQAVERALDQTKNTLSETTEALQAKESDLRNTTNALQQTEQALADKAQTLQSVEAEKSAISGKLSETQSSLQLIVGEKANLENSLRQREAQARQLQTELARQQQETAQREAALAEAEQSLQSLQQTQQQLSTQLQIRETESAILQQNLLTAQAEVERARLEAERAQQRTESLAAGVSQLAASSSELKEEIQKAKPVSMNELFRKFEANRVNLRFQWRSRGVVGTQKESQRKSLLLETSDGLFAIFSANDSPFAESGARDIRLILEVADKAYAITDIKALTADPSVIAFRVPTSIANEAGLQAFKVDETPFAFAEAILISDDRPVYAQIPIRVLPGQEGLFETENRLFNRLFGEFSPTSGDYVFSLTGNLIGIMTSSDQARILQVPQFITFRSLEIPQQ